MKPKLIAIDLDETLLHDDMSISSYSKKIIRQVLENGIPVVIATGRMFGSACMKTRELGLGNVPVISYTGAWIGLCESGKTLFREGLSVDTARALLAEARENSWFIQSYIDDRVCFPEPSRTERAYSKYRSGESVFLGEKFWMPDREPTRLIIVEKEQEKKDAIRDRVGSRFGDAVEMVYPGDDFLDIHKAGVSKGNAIRRLCRKWKIEPEEVMSFGNSENDVSMLAMTHMSYAVSNADGKASAAAEHHTASNNEDGVAEILEKLVLG